MAQALVSNFVIKPALIDIDVDDDLSEAVDCLGLVLIGIAAPSTMETANITFQGSIDGGENYIPLYDEDGTEIQWDSVAASRIMLQTPTQPMIGGITHIKVATSVAQTGTDTELKLIFAVINP
jgi:hypothetical protein